MLTKNSLMPNQVIPGSAQAQAVFKVAVLLPSYNSEKFIEQQLLTIVHQRGVDVDLFVYDDFSTDNTLSILERLSKIYSIKLIHGDARQGNASKSFIHLIISCAHLFSSYDYIALSDHDDIWLGDKLIEAIGLLSSTATDCYSSTVTPVRLGVEDGLSWMRWAGKSARQKNLDFVFEGPGPGCTFVCRSQFAAHFSRFLVANKGRVFSIFWHDWLMYAFARLCGYSWVIDRRSFIFYVQRGGNETGVNSGLVALKRRIRVLANGWYVSQARQICNSIDPNHEVSIRLARFNVFDRIWFAFRFTSLRRRMLDCFIILIFIVINPFGRKFYVSEKF